MIDTCISVVYIAYCCYLCCTIFMLGFVAASSKTDDDVGCEVVSSRDAPIISR